MRISTLTISVHIEETSNKKELPKMLAVRLGKLWLPNSDFKKPSVAT